MQPRGNGSRADSEHTGRLLAVQVEHDAERENLTLPGRQRAQPCLELGR